MGGGAGKGPGPTPGDPKSGYDWKSEYDWKSPSTWLGNPDGDFSNTGEIQSEWDAALARPSDSARQNDAILGANDPDAGKSFGQILLSRKTKGRGIDPFCYDYIHRGHMYYVDLGYYSFPIEAIRCNIATLQKEQWLDQGTKSVELRVILYNGNVDLFTQMQVKFDLTLGGRIFKDVKVTSHQIRNMYRENSDMWRAVVEFIFLLLLVMNAWSIISDLRIIPARIYCRRIPNIINVFGQCMYICNIVLWVLVCIKSARFYVPPDANDYGQAYQAIQYTYNSFDELDNIFYIYKVFNTISIFLNVIRLFIFMGFHGRMGLVTKTVERVWTDLYHFGILFMITVLMLAFMGWNLHGQDSPDFRDFAWTLQTILLMTIGELPDYEMEIWRRNREFGTLFYWFTNLLGMLFLMNVFLSIVIDGYMAAVAETQDKTSILTTGSNSIPSFKSGRCTLRKGKDQHKKRSSKTMPTDLYGGEDETDGEQAELRALRRRLERIVRMAPRTIHGIKEARLETYNCFTAGNLWDDDLVAESQDEAKTEFHNPLLVHGGRPDAPGLLGGGSAPAVTVANVVEGSEQLAMPVGTWSKKGRRGSELSASEEEEDYTDTDCTEATDVGPSTAISTIHEGPKETEDAL